MSMQNTKDHGAIVCTAVGKNLSVVSRHLWGSQGMFQAVSVLSVQLS